MLPTEAVEEYKKLYESRFGIILSDAEAVFRANKLVKFYKAVLGTESIRIEHRIEEYKVNFQVYDKE